jgi:hypothetical protein
MGKIRCVHAYRRRGKEGNNLAVVDGRQGLGGGDVGEDDDPGPCEGEWVAERMHAPGWAAGCYSNRGDGLLGRRRGRDVASASGGGGLGTR